MASELFTLNPTRKRKRKKAIRKAPAKRRKARSIKNVSVKRARKRSRSRAVAYAMPAKTKKYRRKKGSRGSKLSLKNFVALAQEGLLNGAGAFAADIAMGFVRPMLPDVLGFGMGRHFSRVAMGLVLGQLASQFAGKKFANAITTGTATVVGHDVMKEFVQPLLPAGMVLGEYFDSTTPAMGEYVNAMPYQGSGAMGYTNSAPVTPSVNTESAYYSSYN